MPSSEKDEELRDEILECFITVYHYAEAGIGWKEDEGPPKEVEEAAARIYELVNRACNVKE